MFCLDIQPPLWFLFSSDASPLLYYSHFFALVSSLVIGFFVYFKNKRSLPANLLFMVSLFFAIWLLLDVLLWVNIDSRIIVFVWSIINFVEVLVSILTLYFAYSFLEKKDAPSWAKYTFAVLLLPFIVLMNTHFNVEEFDIISCEAVPGDLQYYFYFLELFTSLWLFSYLANCFFRAKRSERKQIFIFGTGVVFFLFLFSGTNIIGGFTENWKILHYGLFGAPIFSGFLGFLIVRYHAFNLKLVAAQALVIGLVLLIGSQFFFNKTTTGIVLTGITFFISSGFGWFLVRSVRQEIKRKEELQLLSDKLAVANERLQKLDLEKSEFISIASHQLRTPLTAIKGYISLMLEGSYGVVPVNIQDVLNKVYMVNDRLAHLVEDLLNVSRIEAGRIQYNFEPTKLEGLVGELVDMFALTAKNKGLTLTLKLSEKPLPTLLIDPNKIKEVVSNIIDNSLKYTKAGGTTVSVEELKKVVRIIISDTGIGIKPENITRLFEKFTRTKETTKMVASGTGLGLYVGKNFVEAHGGKIWAESEGTDKGSKFIIELPIVNPKIKAGTSDQPTRAVTLS